MTNEELSNTGREKREAILRAAQSFAAGRRRRRKVLRAGATTVLAVALSAGVWSIVDRSSDNRGKVAQPTVATGNELRPAPPPSIVLSKPAHRSIEVIHVQTDPTIVDRLRVKAAPPIARLDDNALLSALADAGRPAAIVYFQGRPTLMDLR